MSTGEARPFSSWLAQTLIRGWPMEAWQEPLDAALIWDEIRSYSDVRERGMQLFSGTRRECRDRWDALNDYARQARAYYEALEITAGTARGLLGYYFALNLAKAELVHSQPQNVINKRIGHGLSFDVGRESTIRGDAIKVTEGVFPLLYAARTGVQLPVGTKLPVRQLLARVPEIGREYRSAFGEEGATEVGWYRTVGDRSENFWPIILTHASEEELRKRYEFSALDRAFEVVKRPSRWRQPFPEIGMRFEPLTLLQGRVVFTGTADTPPHYDCVEVARQALGSSLEAPMNGFGDFLMSPSMYKTKNFPMSPFLARYALMFYLSSLVRYRPSRLNPAREQLTVWLLEAFARQSPQVLLANGLEGIIQRSVVFNA